MSPSQKTHTQTKKSLPYIIRKNSRNTESAYPPSARNICKHPKIFASIRECLQIFGNVQNIWERLQTFVKVSNVCECLQTFVCLQLCALFVVPTKYLQAAIRKNLPSFPPVFVWKWKKLLPVQSYPEIQRGY